MDVCNAVDSKGGNYQVANKGSSVYTFTWGYGSGETVNTDYSSDKSKGYYYDNWKNSEADKTASYKKISNVGGSSGSGAIWITLLVIVLVGAAGFAFYTFFWKPKQSSDKVMDSNDGPVTSYSAA